MTGRPKHILARPGPTNSSDAEQDQGGRLDALPLRPASVGSGADDALSDALAVVRLTGCAFFNWQVFTPYAMPIAHGRHIAPFISHGARELISYHVVMDGSCWASVAGGEPRQLRAGEALLVAHGDAYTIADSRHACSSATASPEASIEFFKAMAEGQIPCVVRDGAGSTRTASLVCGFLACDLTPFNPLLQSLPAQHVHELGSNSNSGRLDELLRWLIDESRDSRGGRRDVMVRLGELLFVELLRNIADCPPNLQSGWLVGLRDDVVGPALAALHREPSAAWTLGVLARSCGSSRSRLAERFAEIVGMPPMQYLAHWRMQLAAKAMLDSTASIAEIALDIGYESEPAFRRAFKRIVGDAPSGWRSAARANAGG